MASWFVFLPAMFAIGVRDYGALLAIGIPAVLSVGASMLAVRQQIIGRTLQLAVVGFMLLGAMAISRLYGPLIMMPTMIATYAIVLQAHPARLFRRTGVFAGVLAMTLPLVLELIGVLPASYAFEAGRWIVRPQLLELPGLWTPVFCGLTNLAMIVIPCLFIARLRGDLSTIQAEQMVQAWQFKRLAAG
jgi:hypothetical protein